MANKAPVRARNNGHASSTISSRNTGSEEPFVFTTDDGETITVASLAKPFKTSGELRKMRGASPIDMAYYIIERDCDKAALDLVDAMTIDEFNEFSRQWALHSGIELGE
jgi:hypothetical protein